LDLLEGNAGLCGASHREMVAEPCGDMPRLKAALLRRLDRRVDNDEADVGRGRSSFISLVWSSSWWCR
jgi:hypothetical protein